MSELNVYDGAAWILISNRTHAGYQAFCMEKYEGADNLVEVMDIYYEEEPVDEDNTEPGRRCTLNGAEISYDEFEKLVSEIYAGEVGTYNSNWK